MWYTYPNLSYIIDFSRTLNKLYLYKVIKKRKLPQFLFINNNSISTIFHNLFARCWLQQGPTNWSIMKDAKTQRGTDKDNRQKLPSCFRA